MVHQSHSYIAHSRFGDLTKILVWKVHMPALLQETNVTHVHVRWVSASGTCTCIYAIWNDIGNLCAHLHIALFGHLSSPDRSGTKKGFCWCGLKCQGLFSVHVNHTHEFEF